jgi:ubiquinone/menaquinone biosynthesis C-methylase UbiE
MTATEEPRSMTVLQRSEPTYVFETAHEQQRLVQQSPLFDRITAAVLAEAGLAPGMRVLDLGCGMGDVSIQAARLVGPDGEVVGADADADRVAAARARMSDGGIANVRVHRSDVRSLEGVEGEFDAVVGRLILMYLSDPAAVIRGAAQRLRPGGLVVFHEFQFPPEGLSSQPVAPLFEQCVRWFVETATRAGAETRMGLKLYETFVAAGLGGPEMRSESVVGGGEDFEGYDVLAGVLRGIAPLMERSGVASAEEAGLDTLADRLRAEVTAGGGVALTPALVSAWARG